MVEHGILAGPALQGQAEEMLTKDGAGAGGARTPAQFPAVPTETAADPEVSETTAEETQPWLSQPAPVSVGSIGLTNGMFYGGITLILALLAAAVMLILWRRKKKTSLPRPEEPAAWEVPEKKVSTMQSEVFDAPPAAAPQVLAGAHQHIGARKDQQDSYGISDLTAYADVGVMAVVADGMGGLANGKAVSSTLCNVFLNGISRAHPQANGGDILLDLAVRANAQVNQLLRDARRSGSTLVAALIRKGYLHFLSVGDSRIYLYRGGALIQLNRAHIYQEELAVKAVNQDISLINVRSDRQAQALTSYFGIGRIPAMDRNDEGIRLVDGDRILLASDGVFGTLTAAQMEQAMCGGVKEAAEKIGSMIQAAGKPYQDNNTAVLLEYRS